MVEFMDSALKHGGIHAYDKVASAFRGKSFKFVNKKPKASRPNLDTQVFAIDGEVLYFDDFVKYEIE